MSFLEISLPLAERGFRVFPLVPKDKRPVKLSSGDHFDASTTDVAALEQWSTEVPNANVGLCPDENFCFLETDSETELKAACADLPPEIWDTARVSARDNRCYYIFRQTMRTRKAGNMTLTREGKDNLFEFKQHRVYVTGPGSIHPTTGKPYGVEWRIIPAMPDVLLNRLCELYGAPQATASNKMDAETERQTSLLDDFLECYEVPTTGDWFNKGKQWYRPIICPWDAEHENRNQGTSTCVVYTEGGGYGFDCKHRCEARTWKEFRAEVQSRLPEKKFSFVQTAEVTIGIQATEPLKPKDWRAWFHTKDEAENAPPISFLIDGFLQREGVTAVCGPVRERKSLIALNIVHALLTGDKLFGHFDVVRKPERVLYLCPEVSLGPFTDRVKKIGLLKYVGDTFFYRTLSADGHLKLDEPGLVDALPGSVVFLDTAIRFLEGKENDSSDVRKLADTIFALLKGGAESVVMLHHSPKEMGDTMTLESALRGSGDLGAFLTACWGTRLQDQSKPYESESYLENLKQRDFESQPFEVTSGPDCRLHIVTPSLTTAVLAPRKGFKPKKDDAAADAAIRANLEMSVRKLQEHLASLGIQRGTTWIAKRRADLNPHKTGVVREVAG
jgi:Bifunctional DNA primase/polymerase, N-terminal/AAA domain